MFFRIILLLIIIFIVLLCLASSEIVNKQSDCKETKFKCTAKDPRLIFTRCMLYSKDQSLWCDHSNFTKIPRPDSIWSKHHSCKDALALYINDSCLTDIGKEDLMPYKKIRTFMCGRNRITWLRAGIFVANKNLRTIDFCTNNIRTIDVQAFSDIPQLETLNLANNKINELQKHMFFNLTSLVEISFHNNEISSLYEHVFDGLKNLRILRLSKNRISKLGVYSFNHLDSLTHLHLDENKIRDIAPGTFNVLKHLQVLTVSNNQIKTIGQNTLPSLHTLNLASNLLEKVNHDSVSEFPRLQNLNLGNNSLSAIEKNLFRNNPHLRLLNLEENYIKLIPRKTFQHLCHLETLVLRNNRLHTPLPDWFTSVIKNNKVNGNDLTGNMWNCSCNALEHQEFLRRLKHKKWIQTLDVTCSYPKRRESLSWRYELTDHCLPLPYPPSIKSCNKSESFSPKTETYEYLVKNDEVMTQPPISSARIFTTYSISSKITVDTEASGNNPTNVVIIIVVVVVISILSIMIYRICQKRSSKKRSKHMDNKQERCYGESEKSFATNNKQDQCTRVSMDQESLQKKNQDRTTVQSNASETSLEVV